jgi:S-DNA-T family DNA segregation ATPase FtsK/SpoIIIE
MEIFEASVAEGATIDDEVLRAIGEKIEETLAGFGVPVELVEIERGPTFSRFGLAPGYIERAGQRYRVKLSRITALKHDLALALAAQSVRIEAPIPGRSLVGIEIPNPETGLVRVRSVLEDPRFRKVAREGGLPIAMGREVTGESVVADLARMPHLLVAGATGSGKSVFLNAILVSLLVQNTPDQVQLVLLDPKRVELTRFEGTPHLVARVVTDPADAVGALRWVAQEMDLRYRRFADRGARDRATFNAHSPAGEAPVPALVVVIDELADLMMTAPDEVEPLLTRIAQMGRATGIHLVVATQRPSTDVVTGLIKANFPSRVAFAVSSSIDSRVILDQPGAENLLGRGDMLYQPPDKPQPRRIQGVLVEDDEVDRLLDHWRGSHWAGPGRLTPWEDLRPSEDPEEDLYEEAQSLALHHPDTVSASMLQRRLRIGYTKARALYQRLENDGFFEEDDDEIAGRPKDWVDGEFGE